MLPLGTEHAGPIPTVLGHNGTTACPQLVTDVRSFMTQHRLGQVLVANESRLSQTVVSQWLSEKYRGHNYKVDCAMRKWLMERQGSV